MHHRDLGEIPGVGEVPAVGPTVGLERPLVSVHPQNVECPVVGSFRREIPSACDHPSLPEGACFIPTSDIGAVGTSQLNVETWGQNESVHRRFNAAYGRVSDRLLNLEVEKGLDVRDVPAELRQIDRVLTQHPHEVSPGGADGGDEIGVYGSPHVVWY